MDQRPVPTLEDLTAALPHSSDRVLTVHLDARGLPAIALPAGHMDIVIANAVLQKLVRQRKFISEVRRVLRPGGHALIAVPVADTNYNEYSLRWFLGRYFDVLSVTQIHRTNDMTPLLCATCQRVERTAGFWDLVTRQRKF